MSLTSAMGLSLWLAPSPNELEQLQPVLDDLAKHGNGPAFQPHVTLVSFPSSTALPLPPLHFDRFPPMTLRFLDVETGKSYFQSVLIAVDLIPELGELHDSVRQTLEKPLPPGGSYFAHLSLFYGEDQSVKEALLRRLYEKGTAVKNEGNPGVTVAGLTEIHVREVWLVRSEGPPEEWEVLQKWALGTDEKSN